MTIRVCQRRLQVLHSVLIERAETIIQVSCAQVEWWDMVGLWRESISLSRHCLVHLRMVARRSRSDAWLDLRVHRVLEIIGSHGTGGGLGFGAVGVEAD